MRKFGLIGKQLGHSFSKQFFTNYFSKNEVDGEYFNFEVQNVEKELSNLLHSSVEGFNVTIPYKKAIIPFLDELSEEAREIGAVNCIAKENGKLIGHNTDAFGFHQSIKPFLSNKHERAIIFGTGGASKAVHYVLKKLGIRVIYISREPSGELKFAYEEVNEHMLNACKLLINTTPVGMFPKTDAKLPIPYEHLSPEHLAVDLIYNPPKTQFLAHAEKQGAMIVNGEAMLEQQALKSWEIWEKMYFDV